MQYNFITAYVYLQMTSAALQSFPSQCSLNPFCEERILGLCTTQSLLCSDELMVQLFRETLHFHALQTLADKAGAALALSSAKNNAVCEDPLEFLDRDWILTSLFTFQEFDIPQIILKVNYVSLWLFPRIPDSPPCVIREALEHMHERRIVYRDWWGREPRTGKLGRREAGKPGGLQCHEPC